MFSFRYGRKNTWFAGLLLLIISGVTAAFLPEYWIHVFCRLLSGVAVGGCMTVGFVIGRCLISSATNFLFPVLDENKSNERGRKKER